MIAQIKVTSRLGPSIEEGSSSAINVRSGRTFLLSKVITQCIFGHLKKKNFDDYEYLNNNSNDQDFIEALNFKLQVINYTYAYPKFQKVFKYKTINVKGKRYVQKWKKRDGKYLFAGRFKVKYDSKKKLDKTATDFEMV